MKESVNSTPGKMHSINARTITTIVITTTIEAGAGKFSVTGLLFVCFAVGGVSHGGRGLVVFAGRTRYNI